MSLPYENATSGEKAINDMQKILRAFGLRSTEEGLDVSEIAKQYGGGGHKNASGFRVPYGHELAP